MRSIKYLLGAAAIIVGLTTMGIAHDSYYNDEYGRYNDGGYGRQARREHRRYHRQQEYDHWLYHQYPHSRLDHKLYHLEDKLEHRRYHRYQRDRYDRDYQGDDRNYYPY